MLSDKNERTQGKETDGPASSGVGPAAKGVEVDRAAQSMVDPLAGLTIGAMTGAGVFGEETTTVDDTTRAEKPVQAVGLNTAPISNRGVETTTDSSTQPEGTQPPHNVFEKMLAHLDDAKCEELERQIVAEGDRPSEPLVFDRPDPFGLDWEWGSPDGSDPDEGDDGEIASDHPKKR